jgi:hypothetical protein
MIRQGENLLTENKRGKLKYEPDLKTVSFLDKRYYKMSEDVYYPSVTTYLDYMPKNKFFQEWVKDVGHNADIILERAAREGNQVHSAVEELVLGNTVNWLDEYGNTKYNYLVWNMILKFHEFWTTYKPTLIKTEGVVYSDAHKYAGRYDLLVELDKEVWLLDVKTSNSLHKTYDVQLSCYVKALKETLDIDVERAGIIWLKAQTRGESKKKGIYQGKGWQIKEVEDFDHNFELFKHVQAFFLEDNKDTMPNTIKIPTTLSL